MVDFAKFRLYQNQPAMKFNSRIPFAIPVLLLVLACSCENRQKTIDDKHFSADVIVYGGNSAAVIAAVQVARMGKEVILVSPDKC